MVLPGPSATWCLRTLNGKEIKINTHASSDVSGGDRRFESVTPRCRSPSRGGREPVFRDPRRPGIRLPTGEQDRRDSKTIALLLGKDEKGPPEIGRGRADHVEATVARIGPNQPVTHTHRVFAGPKIGRPFALKAYHAEGLAIYRKNQWIPLGAAADRPVRDRTNHHAALPHARDRTGRPPFQQVVKGGTMESRSFSLTLLVLRPHVSNRPQAAGTRRRRCSSFQPHLRRAARAIQGRQGTADQRDLSGFTRSTGSTRSPVVCRALNHSIADFRRANCAGRSTPAFRCARYHQFLWIRDLPMPDMLYRCFPGNSRFLAIG